VVMEIFNDKELLDASQVMALGFPFDQPDIKTEVSLLVIGDALLSALDGVLDQVERERIVANFVKMAICSGMLIASRRSTINALMWRDNTGMDC
jgi:hypothetical protein